MSHEEGQEEQENACAHIVWHKCSTQRPIHERGCCAVPLPPVRALTHARTHTHCLPMTNACVCVCAGGRAEMLMRHKLSYLERVNAELCEQLEAGDVAAINHAGSLQAEKAELTARMRQLQEEVRACARW